MSRFTDLFQPPIQTSLPEKKEVVQKETKDAAEKVIATTKTHGKKS